MDCDGPGKFGIHTTRKRLIQVRRELKAKALHCKEQEFRDSILRACKAEGSAPAPGAVSSALAGNSADTTNDSKSAPKIIPPEIFDIFGNDTMALIPVSAG